MFRQLGLMLAPFPSPPSPAVAEAAAETVFAIHPIQLSRFLEDVWGARNPDLAAAPAGARDPADVTSSALERDSGIRDRSCSWS